MSRKLFGNHSAKSRLEAVVGSIVRTSKWTRARGAAAAIVCTGVIALGMIPIARADAWDKKTVVTINAPVEVPGRVLLPGTYVFKLLNSSSNRNIVQIYDKDEKQLQATLLAVPDYRVNPTQKPLIQFDERPSNTPEAIKAWFYPGDNYGWEFVYPHDRAVELAKQTNQNVLSMRNEMASNTKTQNTSFDSASNQEMKQTEVTAAKPSGDQVDLALIVVREIESPTYLTALTSSASSTNDAASTSQAPAETTLPAKLPQTASELPLISLLGACLLGLALLVRRLRTT